MCTSIFQVIKWEIPREAEYFGLNLILRANCQQEIDETAQYIEADWWHIAKTTQSDGRVANTVYSVYGGAFLLIFWWLQLGWVQPQNMSECSLFNLIISTSQFRRITFCYCAHAPISISVLARTLCHTFVPFSWKFNQNKNICTYSPFIRSYD